ncbi:MAG: phosphotransferase, partial [Myxococcota bacterium]
AGPEVMRRVGAALAELHRGVVPAVRRHSLDDELRTLRERLEPLRERFGAGPMQRLLEGCEALSHGLCADEPVSVHRDFHPDQVLGDGERERVTFLDLDLYAESHSALDAGNFVAHLTEQALRRLGGVTRLRACEDSFVEGYRSCQDLPNGALTGWTTLALVRLAGLSVALRGRGHTSGALLALCEERLGIRS